MDSKEKAIRIGPCVTASDLITNKHIQDRYKSLGTGADSLGSPLIRNLATIGGNVVTARPAGDLLSPLMAHNAAIGLVSRKGEREVRCEDFFIGPGQTAIKDDEILKEIIINTPPPFTGCIYIKLGIRQALEIGIINVAVFITLEKKDGPIKDARIVLGSVAPTPVRAVSAEKALLGEKPTKGLFKKAAEAASGDCSPIDDFRGSAGYRREMVKNLTKRALINAHKESVNN